MSPQPLLVGSETWTGGEQYGDAYSARIQYFQTSFSQSALLAHASSVRGGVACRLTDKFTVGSFHFVKKIVFDDGVEWIARLRMPSIEEFEENGEKAEASRTEAEIRRELYEMQSELDTIQQLLRLCDVPKIASFLDRAGVLSLVLLHSQHTDIPVPKVHAYSLDANNPVGCPYSLLDYVHGSTAEEVAAAYPGDHEGVPEKYEEKFMRQVARVMCQLASLRMPKIGSIVRSSSNPGSFEVGPLVETGSGPYETAAAFYQDYPIALAKTLYGDDWQSSGHGEVPQAFRSLALSFTSDVVPADGMSCSSAAPGFGLANYDLGPNNFIVDAEFNVLAVIDWDAVIAVPDTLLYRFPFLMGVSCAVPGIRETHPRIRERERLGRRFAEIVDATWMEWAEKADWRERGGGVLFAKEDFYSKEAVAFRALVHYKSKQDWVDDEWLRGLKWLSEHDDREFERFYMTE